MPWIHTHIWVSTVPCQEHRRREEERQAREAAAECERPCDNQNCGECSNSQRHLAFQRVFGFDTAFAGYVSLRSWKRKGRRHRQTSYGNLRFWSCFKCMDNSGFYSYLSVHVLLGFSRRNSCDNLKFFSWTKRMRSGWTALFPHFLYTLLSWKLRQGVYQSQCSLETTRRWLLEGVGLSGFSFHVICRVQWDMWHSLRQKEEEERQRFEEASRFKADNLFWF